MKRETKAPPASASEPLVDAEARLRVLAAVSAAFAEVVTDYPVLLETVARVVADLVGDGCLVTLLDDDGDTLISSASAHQHPELDEDYRAYLAHGPRVSLATSLSVSASVVRSGAPKVVGNIDPATVVAQSEESLKPAAARLNVHSFAVVPIRGRKTVLGSLSLLRSRPGLAYSPEDVVLLQDLADRAGLALENARLYGNLERRVAERTAELETANAELESFSYSVAHDLRGPLRSIDGFSQAIIEDCGDELGPQAKRHLARVRSAAQQMGRLIDDLLKLSQVSRTELRRRTVPISDLAAKIVGRLRELDPQRDASTEVVIAPGLYAHADGQLVDALLTNLLGNAWKFTAKRESARIELGVQADQDPPVYFVSDNGAGFEPQYASKLFGTFQRLHTNLEFEGTGIGLATVQRIVRRHGGRVWGEGEVDRGARFYFTLEPAEGADTSGDAGGGSPPPPR